MRPMRPRRENSTSSAKREREKEYEYDVCLSATEINADYV